jgi:4-hydroxythreonine-4-phosphate dehydrogenase
VSDRPLVAVTMGDPAGVGPEVTLKALQREEVWRTARPLVIGDADVLSEVSQRLGLAMQIDSFSDVEEASFENQNAQVLDLANVDIESLQPGQVSMMCGHAAVGYIEKALDLALSGTVSAIATGPINKSALRAAGYPFRGHTELLAKRCKSAHVVMMLITPGRGETPMWLRVAHVTTHIALAQVPGSLSRANILKTIELSDQGLQQLGIDRPRLALAALNPHASDRGLMGVEEAQLLDPVIKTARQKGFDLSGPVPADTVFLRHMQGEFDGVIALYHDQGHIAVKTHGFDRAVNVTLGLPIIRTSVDHGTAFDIAWQGVAKEDSLVEAIQLASQLQRGSRQRGEKHVA